MKIFVTARDEKVEFSVQRDEKYWDYEFTPDAAEELGQQIASVLKYYARAARGEKLPFKYHILDTSNHPDVKTNINVNLSGSVFATTAHSLVNATKHDLGRWVKKSIGGYYAFCEFGDREGKFIGFMTIDGKICAIIDTAVGIA